LELVWVRPSLFLTVFATLFVAFIPFFVIYAPGVGRSSVGVFVVRSSMLPHRFCLASGTWFVAFAMRRLVLAGVIAVGFCNDGFVGGNLSRDCSASQPRREFTHRQTLIRPARPSPAHCEKRRNHGPGSRTETMRALTIGTTETHRPTAGRRQGVNHEKTE